MDIELVQEACLLKRHKNRFAWNLFDQESKEQHWNCEKKHTINEVDDIVNALKSEFKHETSSVVEGRILAPRLEKGNYQTFSKTPKSLQKHIDVAWLTRAYQDQRLKK